MNRTERNILRPRRAGFTLIELLVVIGIILLLTAITVTVITGITSRSEIRETENTMRIMENALHEWEIATSRAITFGVDGEPCNAGERYEIRSETLNNQAIKASDPWADNHNDAARDTLLASDRLWSILSRASASRDMLGSINPNYMIEVDPALTSNPPHFDLPTNANHLNERIGYRFLDAWDNPILAILPGRTSQRPITGAGGCIGDVPYCYGNPIPTGLGHCPDPDGTIRTPYENRYGVAVNRKIFFVSAGPSGRFGNLRLHRARTHAEFNAEEAALAADNIYSYPVLIEEARP